MVWGCGILKPMKRVNMYYNHRNMLTPVSEWNMMLPRLADARREVIRLADTGTQGFMNLPFDRYAQRMTLKAAERFKKKCTDLVVLGIGGSDLGARALYQTLIDETRHKGIRLHFSGSSTDPDDLARLIRTLDFKRTSINVISKSGGTLETMAAFLVLREKLQKHLGIKTASERIIATTDPESGSLRELAHKEHYPMLPIPPNVGGRFSVLTAVGLFPAAVAGLQTASILRGASAVARSFQNSSAEDCHVCRFSGLHVLGMERRKQNIHITMPYSKRMSEFASWVRQLIAESLGKKGKGPTPVACIGPEDQHSQLQLWSEGPKDKIVTFIEVKMFQEELRTPRFKSGDKTIDGFGGKSFTNLIHLERYATATSLHKLKRPNATITIPQLDETTLGELFMFYELSVAMMGQLMKVNAYDQPGVEHSKKLIRQGLN